MMIFVKLDSADNLFGFLVKYMHITHIESHGGLVAHFVAGSRVHPGDKFTLACFQEKENLIPHQLGQIDCSFYVLGDDLGGSEIGIVDILRPQTKYHWFSQVILIGCLAVFRNLDRESIRLDQNIAAVLDHFCVEEVHGR